MRRIIAAVLIVMTFLPVSALGKDKNITRIEFIAGIMHQLQLGYTDQPIEIADLEKDSEYYQVAVSAMQHGIVAGYGANKIKPHEPIKREDAWVLLCRAFNVKPTAELYLAGVKDRRNIADYAKGAASAVVHNNIIENGGTLNPKGHITVAEAEDFINSFKNHLQKRLGFSYGYPRLAAEPERGKITLEVRTTLPCEVYYKLLPSGKHSADYIPPKDEIDKFLTSIAIADTVVDAHITPLVGKEYDLYIMAVDKDGKNHTLGVIRQVAAHPYTVGDGSKDNPYRIYDENQLRSIKYYPESHFRLEQNIELTEKWIPIGLDAEDKQGFSGVLDGDYHKITNIQIEDKKDNTGFFREIDGGTVKRLYLEGTIYGRQGVGILAGKNAGGTIEECFVTGRVHATGNNAGAIAGVNEGRVENSVAAAYLVEGAGYTGGIIGSNRGGTVIDCLSAVYSVSADMYASGVAGINIGGVISNTVCANAYSDDIMTVKNGRITTNKEGGSCLNNYAYDKMFSDSEVVFGSDTADGLEVSWQELTDRDFYSEVMGWDADIWANGCDEHFRLPLPTGFNRVNMIPGITMYAPVQIGNKAQLEEVRSEPNMHYILTSDIDYNGRRWEMIAENGSAEDGFGGTFDGNNHTISNLHIGKKDTGNNYGMFGVISSGTVRNLHLNNLSVEGESLVGGIAAENYGYIENCSVSGKIYALRKDNMLSVGGICGNNYGFVEQVAAKVKIRADGQVLTIGGIAANNEGFINNSEFIGSLNAELSDEYSNAVVGGICGINMGILYNSYAKPNIFAKASTNYVGGIVGIADSGEVYKTAAEGEAVIYSRQYMGATAYAGGIVGLAQNGLIMNSHSGMNISADSNTVYAGGVAGYNVNSSVQNTYSTNNIDVLGKRSSMEALCFAGGICGFSEGGFITDSVALNGKIISNGITAAVGNSAGKTAVYANNYSTQETEMVGVRYEYSVDGERRAAKAIRTRNFFFKSIADGGILGWSEGDIWYMKGEYELPLLWDVS